MLYMRLDQVMIKEIFFRGIRYYSASVKVAEFWYFIPMTVTSVMFPLLINSKK